MKTEWEKYKEYLNKLRNNSEKIKKLRVYADQQYEEAEELYNKLSVYASEHAVPLEWR